MINLIKIEQIIEHFFKGQSLVGSVKLGSVYDNLNTGNLRYPVLNIDHIETVHNNFDTYNFYIYFADRLTENHNNSNYIVTSGINIIKMFTKYMEDNFNIQTPVTITPFIQKFADDTAGVWARVSIEVSDDMEYCEDEIDIPTLYIVENGEYNTVEYDKVIVNVQGGLPDAPSDGKSYVRKDGEWVEETIVDISGKQDKLTAGTNISIVDNVISATDTVYDDTEIRGLIAGKQDVITDLATIREGAALGATALQEVPNEYAKKSDIPTVPTFTFDSATATLNITL